MHLQRDKEHAEKDAVSLKPKLWMPGSRTYTLSKILVVPESIGIRRFCFGFGSWFF